MSLIDTDPKPMDTNQIESENRNIKDSQRQDVHKEIQMEKYSKVS